MLKSLQNEPEAEFSIDVEDFQRAFGEPISPYLQSKIRQYNFRFTRLSAEERDLAIRRFTEALLHGNLVRSGEARHSHWEAGWGENFSELEKSLDIQKIIPKYFEKYETVRWRQEWIKPASPTFEYRMLAVIQDWLFDRYLRNADAIYEFGCGTGHNLFRMRSVNPNAELFGLDWATSSQKIIEKLRADGIDQKIFGKHFDYFNPDYSVDFKANSAVVTIASLEQTADRFGPFVDYLLKKRPSICIHIEPIAELLDPKHLLDYLSIEYFKKRNYLSGFFTHLKSLESAGKLSIERAQRTYVGSFFIEGYSVIVWKPN